MNTIPQIKASGSHSEVGLVIGHRFRDQIHHLCDNYGFLQERLLPFHHSPAGRGLYASFLELHTSHFPGYMAELEGIAQGAGRPFEELFLVNLRGEYGGLMALERPAGDAAESSPRGCTDCLVLTSDVALLGHNEDGPPAALGNVFVVRAHVEEQPAFSALCYPGFLPGNALGFNTSGVLHTVDAVSPRQVRVGLGRHFLARSLLDATSLKDAVRRVTVPGRAAGFTYNIGSLSERSLVCVEVSPEQHHVHEVQGYYVHTNHYLHLSDVEQEIGTSSRARLARGRALCQATPPNRALQLLSLLGDEADGRYPIYRSATPPDAAATLCTALFDLDQRQLRIFAGHPERESDRHLTMRLE
jgi:hypothetical protein